MSGPVLTPAQREGRACLRCGDDDGRMVPLGLLDGVPVRGHPGCWVGSADSLMRAARRHAASWIPGDRVTYQGRLADSRPVLVMVAVGLSEIRHVERALEDADDGEHR